MVEPFDSTDSSVSDQAAFQHAQDIVADLPDEVVAYRAEFGELPAGLQYEKGVYCVWGERTFIHTRATLPLKAIDDGVGFGLWVELEPSEFSRYMVTVTDDAQYGEFETSGVLANSWPGFMQTHSLPVRVQTIRMNEKVYITEVKLDRVRDVLFEAAVSAEENSPALHSDILALVRAWLGEDSEAAPAPEAKPEVSEEVEAVGMEAQAPVVDQPMVVDANQPVAEIPADQASESPTYSQEPFSQEQPTT